MITVSFTFAPAETRHAMRYMALRSRGPILMGALGLGLLAVGVASAKTVVIGVGGAELFAWLVLIAALPRISRAGAGEQTLRFSDEGVVASNAGGSQRFAWDHWRRWRRTGDLYLLRGSGNVFTFVPCRVLGEQDAAFRELLTSRLGRR